MFTDLPLPNCSWQDVGWPPFPLLSYDSEGKAQGNYCQNLKFKLENLLYTVHWLHLRWKNRQQWNILEHSSNKYPSIQFKVNNRNTRKRYEICSKLTIMTQERHHWRHSGGFIVNSEHILQLFLVFLLLNLNK